MTILGKPPKFQKSREISGEVVKKWSKRGPKEGPQEGVFPLESPHENHFLTRKNDENVKNAKNDTF
jgi:hypothetical protein